jgi:hypothetical protein
LNKDFIQRLLDERNTAIEEARALVESAEAEKRDLSAEECEQFDRINSTIDEKAGLVDNLIKAEERSKAARTQQQRGVS